jgi:hypothetical protein
MGSRRKYFYWAADANLPVLHQLAGTDRSQKFEGHAEFYTVSRFSALFEMLPSYLAGVYEADQLHFDLQKNLSKLWLSVQIKKAG